MQTEDIFYVDSYIKNYTKNSYIFTGSVCLWMYSLIINRKFRDINDIDIYVLNDNKEKVEIYFFNISTKLIRKPKQEEIRNNDEIALDISHNFNHDFIKPNKNDTLVVQLAEKRLNILKPEFILCSKLFKKRAIRKKDKYDINFIVNNIKLDLGYLNSLIEKIPFYNTLLNNYNINEIVEKIKNNQIYPIIERKIDKEYSITKIKDINPEEKNILLNLKNPNIYETLFETIFFNINPKTSKETYLEIKTLLDKNKKIYLENRSSYYLYCAKLYKKTNNLITVKKILTTKKPIVFYLKKI
jgi:hypothetical protein